MPVIRSLTALALGAALAFLTACSESGTPSGTAGTAGAAGTTAAPTDVVHTGVDLIPSLFLAAEPGDVRPLAEVKPAAKAGDEVVFRARIGGRRDPFVEQRAVFLVADPALLDCSQLHGDGCKTPWDYCCEPRDSLLKNTATVQVVDEAGRPLHVSLAGTNGLDPLRTIVVQGRVAEADQASGQLVVNATGFYVVEEG